MIIISVAVIIWVAVWSKGIDQQHKQEREFIILYEKSGLEMLLLMEDDSWIQNKESIAFQYLIDERHKKTWKLR